ncbi:hypothetical protein KC19_3G216900 [Ceratodon purpureus]|uniref:Uncharacterized protein n=1 Tax=Ceratodon purpureus TaxID=3225 RepID=A0A8T0IMT0_CERPU|nr:hypothetical protein KC19_3G216900 [Ceratodon purpureus]
MTSLHTTTMAMATPPCITARMPAPRRASLARAAAAGPVNPAPTVTTRDSDDGIKLVHQSRRTFLWSGAAAGFLLGSNNAALAEVKLVLSNIEATPVPCPDGQTTVTGGTSFGVRCFRVTGDVNNPVKQAVYNADIFGRVYDAQGEPALDAEENLRIDTLAEVPPGTSKVSFQIAVSESQAKLGPLKLKNFKATGYLGKVNNRQGSGRIDEMDFSELDEDYVP